MNILVLGSEGFIGNHCVTYFMSKRHSVSGMDLYEQPVRNYKYYKVSRLSPEFDEILQRDNFEAVINASGSGNVPYSVQHPLSDFESNCLDTIRILDALRKYRPGCKYIHLSSAAVYGNPVRLPIYETDDSKPMSPYGWHKLVSETLCREYTSLFNLRTGILRPFSVYGPGLKKQLFWDLYQKSVTSQHPVELFGTGNESRDFIHVTDLVRAINCVLDRGEMEGEQYNVASGIETSIAEAVALFFKSVGTTTGWHFNGEVRAGDPLNWKADTTKLGKLGFRVELELKEGLAGLSTWMKQLQRAV